NLDPTFPEDTDPDPKGEEGEQGGYGYPVHDILLGNDILIVENLCNLDKINRVRGIYSFLPLKLMDSDGSPIRAVYISDK
ncbi:MAG: cyclase family protein, partial [Deltaproteobacteria bacterium]